MKIAVIGAGMAGLAIARMLNETHQVSIFDKGRGVGGRMSHRRHQDFDFDHGAQYVTIRDGRFQHFLETYCEHDAKAFWPARFVSIENAKITHCRQWHGDHVVGVPSMNGMTKSLARNLNIFTSIKVDALTRLSGQWHLYDDDKKSLGEFDMVILTAPLAQTSALIPTDCSFKKALEDKKMHACYTLMLGFDKNPIIDFDAAFIKDELLSWMSVNSSKPGRNTKPSLVINSTNKWADNHLDKHLEDVKQEMMDKAYQLLPFKSKPVYADIHRWRYANIEAQNGPKAYFDKKLNLAACGDWCIKGRVESAFISALSLYDMMGSTLITKT